MFTHSMTLTVWNVDAYILYNWQKNFTRNLFIDISVLSKKTTLVVIVAKM